MNVQDIERRVYGRWEARQKIISILEKNLPRWHWAAADFATSILSAHPEFSSPEVQNAVKGWLARKFEDYQIYVTLDQAQVKIDKAKIESQLRSEFEAGWKYALRTLRKTSWESWKKGTYKKRAIQNSYYFKYLFQKKKNEVVDQRMMMYFRLRLPGRPGPLYIIQKGNIAVSWAGIEYGGFSPVRYQGLDILERFRAELERLVNGRSLRQFLNELKNKAIVKDVTKFVENLVKDVVDHVVKDIDRDFTGTLEPGAVIGRVKSSTGKWYELYITRAKRVGARFSLIYNRKNRK